MNTEDIEPFDEEWYLRNNPDVAVAVDRGRIPSGHAHYINFGKAEGRQPAPLDDASKARLTKDSHGDLPIVARGGNCKICGHESPLFDVVDFGKYCDEGNHYGFGLTGTPIYYLRCLNCGFVFTEFFNDWSPEKFGKHIYNEHYSKVDPAYLGERPEEMASIVVSSLSPDAKQMRILDYGAGSGIFSEHLKKNGFANCQAYDPFTRPSRPREKFDLITCFEVIEHSANPGDLLKDMLDFLTPDGIIVFSTGIQPPSINQERARWWYIGPRNGHISIFTDESLHLLARNFSLHYLKGDNFLCFSRRLSTPSAMEKFNFLPFLIHTLDSKSGSSESWHGAEVNSALAIEFRWSSASNIVWEMPFDTPSSFYLKLKLPYIEEIYPGFAGKSYIQVASSQVKMDVTLGKTLCLEAVLKCLEVSSPVTIRLVTPDTVSPSQLGRNPDKRKLGLAVPSTPIGLS